MTVGQHDLPYKSAAVTDPDPGDGGTIRPMSNAHVPMSCGASNETRTLAAPDFLGQELLLSMESTSGGEIWVTGPDADLGFSHFLGTARNVAKFQSQHDFMHLFAQYVQETLVWRAHGAGAAAPSFS